MASTSSVVDRASESATAAPVLLDFGKQKRKAIRQLRKGNGKLMEELNSALEELRAAGAIAPTAQPVIVIVRQKRRRMKGLNGLLPGV